MEKISVIVPVYNAEKYLKKTLNSILSQTYENLEVILIDDGSKDNSLLICQEFAKKDSRIKLFSVENGGPSSARNIGISKATGTYIGFCDSDDIIDENIYQTLHDYLIKAEADIAFCDIYSERTENNFGFPWEDGKIFNGQEIYNDLMAKMIGNLSDNDVGVPVWGSVVRCLFRREIIEKSGAKFPTDIYFAEDLVFVLRYLLSAKKAVICDKALYHYVQNEESIMNSFFSYKKGMFKSRRALVSYIEDIIKKTGEEELRDRLTVTERCYYNECVGNACRAKNNKSKKEIKSEIREIVCDKAVEKAFLRFDAKDLKTRIKYNLIKRKRVGLLYFYYSKRFK